MERYKILRFFDDARPAKTLDTGLDLYAAQAHCSRPDTRGTLRSGVQWFDGYTAQRQHTPQEEQL